ncbi:MAG: DUF3021 domain-containing protein [Lachnospiraceae bacterium]|nr:DUF3021 domain-containing protein [Lachnospiraceae bacterium]
MKEILKNTVISMVISLTIFCILGVVFDLIYGGDFSMTNYRFTKMVVGCLLVGIGFGTPAVIYQKKNLPRAIQVVVHMGIGCAVYTAVAFAVGWIPTVLGPWICAAIVAGQLAVAFVIWFLFMVHLKKEAKEINKRLQELKKADRTGV